MGLSPSFYFVIFVMVIVSTVQTRYRNKLEALRAKERGEHASASA